MSDVKQEVILEKLNQLERRISRLEARAENEDVGDFVFVEEAAGRPGPAPPRRPIRSIREPLTATRVLGWGGVLALVLAATYLIKLGIDLGWLTPTRQVMLAFLGGAGLIGSGLVLRRADREYASLLPAGGVAILFLSIYGAHLYYRLIEFPAATGAVALVCLLSLWLCRHFASEMYAYVAIVGSYTAPLLLKGLRADVVDLAIYYTAWSLLYCACAIWLQQRRIYLVAAYLALLGFDLIWYQQWHHAAHPQWQAALVFQALQFVIFTFVTAFYTLHHDQKLDQPAALGHLPPLLLFYALEYGLLSRYLPAYAPWIAIGSLAVLLAVYAAARIGFRYRLEGGQLILSAYAALVLFHAGYLELLPDAYAPGAGLLAGITMAGWIVLRRGMPARSGWPLVGALGLVFVINALRAALNFDLKGVPGGDYLALAYAAELYVAYVLVRKTDIGRPLAGALLYAGHLSAMAAPVHMFDERLPVSFNWALLAVLSLLAALKTSDRMLAQSSLFVFAVSGAKVMLYDLDQAEPLIRIGCLVILGVSFYVGGWLYRRVDTL